MYRRERSLGKRGWVKHDRIPTLEKYNEIEVRNIFTQQRNGAKQRGIPWKFTFEEWCDVWLASGKWSERGRGSDQYCMHRLFDVGPYSKDNVEIITNRQNHRLKTITRA